MTDTLIITKADLDETNTYIGSHDVSNWQGSIQIEANLGWVKFKGSVKATKSILCRDGSGIKAGWSIEAGDGIKAGDGIEAGLSIHAKTIASKLRIFAGLCIWKNPSPEEMSISAKLIEGEVIFGNLIEPESDDCDEAIEPLSPNEIKKLRNLIAA